MTAIQPAFDIRCLGTIRNVNTTPPSVVIVPALGGPLVTATDFTPTQLSTMLMCLSIDMRQVTYVMKPHPDGYRAHEVFCVGEVPSVVKEEEKDIFFHSEGADRQKAKSGRRKEYVGFHQRLVGLLADGSFLKEFRQRQNGRSTFAHLRHHRGEMERGWQEPQGPVL